MSDERSGDREIIEQIGRLVSEERGLREQHEHRLTPVERQRIRDLETSLDQCWDLLRQRRAQTEFGGDPEEAKVRPESEVEGYRQ